MRHKKKLKPNRKKAINTVKEPDDRKINLPKEEVVFLILTLILSVIYFVFSKTSTGFYQHDEAAHFVSMRTFWYDYTSALGNWSKPGFKLVYALPALLGEQFVIYFNCLIASFSSFFVYKIGKQLKSQYAPLAFFLLATQPMWIMISSRNYAELLSAFLIVLGVYLHYKEKYYWSAIIVSYLCLVRQEFYLLYGMYGLYLLFQKKFLPAVVSVIPQIVISIWSYIANGDILYIYTSIFDFSEIAGDAYPRQGFAHYFKMSSVIFGSVNLTMFFAYIAIKLVTFKRVNILILSAAIFFFLLHSLFNSKTLDFGPSSGGNLRYMVVIAPLIALLATFTLDEFVKLGTRQRIIWATLLAGFVAAIGIFQTYDHNNIIFNTKRNWEMLYFAIPTALVLIIPFKKINPTILTVLFATLSFILSASAIKPYELSDEDNTMKEVAEWYQQQLKIAERGRTDTFLFDENTQVVARHTLFFYYQGKTMYDFPKPVVGPSKESIDTVSVGSLIIWDSHYCYRPKLRKNDLPVDFYLNRPYYFHFIKHFISKNKKFNTHAFIKTRELNTTFEAGMDSLAAQKWSAAQQLFEQVFANDNNNYVAINQLGICLENNKKYNQAIQYYNKAIEMNEYYHQAFFQRANLLIKFQKNDEAISDINKAIAQYPQNFQYHFLKGSILFSKENYNDAIKSYNEALKINGKLPGAFYNVAMCQLKLNEKPSAKKNLEKAKSLGSKEAVDALKKNFP